MKRRIVPFLLLVLLAPALLAGEAIYLQNGEEYHGTVCRIAEGKLHCTIADKPRAFPLAQIQRIEFQRARLLDEARKAADLPDHLPFFRRALRPATAELRRKFPQAGYVVLEDRTVVTLGTRGVYEIKRFRAWRILQARGADSAMRAIRFFPDRQEVEVLFGLTVAPDGTVAHLADSAMKDEALHARLPDYNFAHRLRFTLKGAVPGATFLLATVRRARASVLEPLVVDRVFRGSEPILRQSVRLAAYAEQKAKVAVAAANGLTQAEHDLWEATDAPKILSEPLMPPVRSFAPRLLLVWPKASWAAIARGVLRRAGGAAALRGKAEGGKALFDSVRQAVRLEEIPLSDLPDGPATPARTRTRGFGNQLERALLVAALLRGAGWQAETVLVRGRSSGPLLPLVPRLHGFDQAVVRATRAGDATVHWLQLDDEDRGFGELATDAQGAQGLNLHTGQIVTIPARAPADESLTRTVDIQLAADGRAAVADVYRVRGDLARQYRDLKNLTQAELTRWATRYVGSEITGVDLLAEPELTDLAKANAEETITLRYAVPGLADRAGNFLLVRLPNAQVSASDVGRIQRQHGLFWDGPDRRDARFTITPPKGYAVYALSEGLEKAGDGWSVRAGFARVPERPGVVQFHDLWQRSALAAPKHTYPLVRDALLRRSRLRNEVIVFVKK